MSKKRKAETDALKRAHDEQEAKRKEADQFNKKLFPEGVLQKDPSAQNEPFSNPLGIVQARLELSHMVQDSLAKRLENIQEGKTKNQKATTEKRKQKTRQTIENLLAEYNIIINDKTTAPQLVNKLIEKGAENIPDVKTFRKYLNK